MKIKICKMCGTTDNIRWLKDHGVLRQPNICRECEAVRARAYRATPEGKRATQRAQLKYRKLHPELVKDRQKKYAPVWKDKNPDYRKEYYEKHREHERATNREWLDNPLNYSRKLLSNHRYRALKRGRTYETVCLEEISNYSSRVCGICEVLIEGKYDIDHIIPLSKGGNHTLDNLQLAHPTCNNTKHAKVLEVA